MSEPIFLTMTGEHHGLVSAGCGSKPSIGRYAQVNHEDQIFALSLLSGWGYEKQSERRCISFHKFIDKSTPLLALGINENERYFLEFDFYRINQFGHFEKYYFIELRGASIVALQMNFDMHSGLDTECITVAYDYIRCRHLIAATEYYHFALPANYNSLFSVQNPIVAARNAAQRSMPKVNVSKPFGTVKTPTPTITPVFAKSCLRGTGCTDAGTGEEPAENFGQMAFYQSASPAQANVAALAGGSIAGGQFIPQGASFLRYLSGTFRALGSWLVRSSPQGAFVFGMMPGSLNSKEEDFLRKIRLEQIADQKGSAPTRVRFKWQPNENGQLEPRGYHTSERSGQDHVPVRHMQLNRENGNYEFTTEGVEPVTIYWNPATLDFETPTHTGDHDELYLPATITVTPIPEKIGSDIESYPAPEESSFEDYILILPIPDMPPIYVYLSKPPVKFLDVDLYSNLKGRSRQGKYEADHMPSAAAVRAYFKRLYPDLESEDLDEYAQDVAAIIIPKSVHQSLSMTYGGRNTPTQIYLDSQNLRAAVDSNLDAIKPALKEHGATEEKIEAARAKMHKLNNKMGLYE